MTDTVTTHAVPGASALVEKVPLETYVPPAKPSTPVAAVSPSGFGPGEAWKRREDSTCAYLGDDSNAVFVSLSNATFLSQ